MDTSNGKIYEYDSKKMKKLLDKDPEAKKRLKQMALDPTTQQLKSMKVKRNDPCPCGSGIKFKKCCLKKEWQYEK